ncbi:MAG: hypothetical protein IJS60_00265 [Abditibacteriota bacterium]|nr:hypothetical protein [Abditibacteriota bacterium]
MLKVIFFDWDGTCHNSIPKITESYIYAMTELGYKVDLEKLRAHYGEAMVTFPKSLCPENPDKYLELYINKCHKAPWSEDAKILMRELNDIYQHTGHYIGVPSDNHSWVAPPLWGEMYGEPLK